jgi:hypothetical protein
LQDDLAYFEDSLVLWKSKGRHFTIEGLNPDAWLVRQQERLKAATAETAP